jgi:hypothetical protein
MEDEGATMVAKVEIQLTHEAMPLVITPMTLVFVADTTPLQLLRKWW